MHQRIKPSLASTAIGGLLILNAGLIAAGFLAGRPMETDRLSRPGKPPPRFPAFEMHTKVDVADTATDPILARPVFFASRRPFVAPAAPPPAVASRPPPPDPLLILDGLVVGESLRAAHLGTSIDRDGRWFKVGQSINGWVLVAVSDAEVLLRRGDRTQHLPLYKIGADAFRLRKSQAITNLSK